MGEIGYKHTYIVLLADEEVRKEDVVEDPETRINL